MTFAVYTSKMSWFGSTKFFHFSCLNSFAHALACSSDVPVEKVLN